MIQPDQIPAESTAVHPYGPEASPILTPDQIERASRFGTVLECLAGELLFRRGDRRIDFYVALSGTIEIVENEGRIFTTHRAGQFTGEVNLFNDRKALVDGRMGEPGRVLRIVRSEFRKMLLAEPDIGELVMKAFVARRVGFIMNGHAAVTLIGSGMSADAVRIERFLRRNGHPLRSLDADCNGEARALMDRAGLVCADLPAVLVPGSTTLVNPDNAELAEHLGLAEDFNSNWVHDVAVVGAGPAGLAAAVYAASEGLTTLVLEAEAPGGQAGTSSRIENYLGFPTGLSGQSLAGRATVQAMRFGAKISLPRRVAGIDCSQRPYRVRLDDGREALARTVVIATGAHYRGIQVQGCGKFEGMGIHYAASTIEARLCSEEEVAIVGGGNSAGQAAMFLSRSAKHVHILVRGPALALTMSDYLVDRIEASDRITIHTRTQIVAVRGEDHLEGISWRHADAAEAEDRPIRHVFLMVGATPNSAWLGGCVATDKDGFICVGPGISEDWPLDRPPFYLETSRPGIFAVGDVRAGSVKRVASAVGEGSIAVQFIHKALEEARLAEA